MKVVQYAITVHFEPYPFKSGPGRLWKALALGAWAVDAIANSPDNAGLWIEVHTIKAE